jgi:signal transduction histidine kinase
LDAEGLVGAVQSFLSRVAVGNPTAIGFSLRGEPYPLPSDKALGLLRICQEAVVNALRHAQASKIRVQITYQPSGVDLSVHDNGRGFDPKAHVGGKGFGLISMRERAERIGARIEISGEPGQGTRLTVAARTSPGAAEGGHHE